MGERWGIRRQRVVPTDTQDWDHRYSHVYQAPRAQFVFTTPKSSVEIEGHVIRARESGAVLKLFLHSAPSS
jgi:hypothetical protein